MGLDGLVYWLWCQRFKCSNTKQHKAFTFLSYDREVIRLLPAVVADQFPAIVTTKFAVDKRVWSLIMRQIRHGHAIDDIASMLSEMAMTAHYQHYALALAHRIANQELRKKSRSPAEYDSLPPFTFPQSDSRHICGVAPGPELIKNLFMYEMEQGGLEDELRRRMQLLHGKCR